MRTTAHYIIEQLKKIDSVKICELITPHSIKLKLNDDSYFGIGKEYVTYTPTREEYIVSMDVVDRAIEIGANHLACPSWCSITQEAIAYGSRIGVRVYKLNEYFRKIEQYEEL